MLMILAHFDMSMPPNPPIKKYSPSTPHDNNVPSTYYYPKSHIMPTKYL